jgi:hypothetical protein
MAAPSAEAGIGPMGRLWQSPGSGPGRIVGLQPAVKVITGLTGLLGLGIAGRQKAQERANAVPFQVHGVKDFNDEPSSHTVGALRGKTVKVGGPTGPPRWVVTPSGGVTPPP